MIEKNELITLEDGNEYLVVDIVEIDSKRYLYLINHKNEKDLLVVEETIENNESYVEKVEDEETIKKVFMILYERLVD